MISALPCPSCQEALRVTPELVGRRVQCARCNTIFRVPSDQFSPESVVDQSVIQAARKEPRAGRNLDPSRSQKEEEPIVELDDDAPPLPPSRSRHGAHPFSIPLRVTQDPDCELEGTLQATVDSEGLHLEMRAGEVFLPVGTWVRHVDGNRLEIPIGDRKVLVAVARASGIQQQLAIDLAAFLGKRRRRLYERVYISSRYSIIPVLLPLLIPLTAIVMALVWEWNFILASIWSAVWTIPALALAGLNYFIMRREYLTTTRVLSTIGAFLVLFGIFGIALFFAAFFTWHPIRNFPIVNAPQPQPGGPANPVPGKPPSTPPENKPPEGPPPIARAGDLQFQERARHPAGDKTINLALNLGNDGQPLAALVNRKLTLWEVTQKQPSLSAELPIKNSPRAFLSPGLKYVVQFSAPPRGILTLFELPGLQKKWEADLKIKKGSFGGLAFSPAEKLLAVAQGKNINLLDVATGKEAQPDITDLAGTSEVTFRATGQNFVGTGVSPVQTAQAKRLCRRFWPVAPSHDGRWLFATPKTKPTQRFDVASGQESALLEPVAKMRLRAQHLCSKGRWLAFSPVGTAADTLVVVEAAPGQEVGRRREIMHNLWFAGNEPILYLQVRDPAKQQERLIAWDFENRQEWVGFVTVPGKRALSLSTSPGHPTLAVLAPDGVLRLWDVMKQQAR